MTPEEIRKKVRELEILEQKHRIKVLDKYHTPWKMINYYPMLKTIREQCEHNWLFTDFGPLGDPWFRCTRCNLHQMINEKD